MELFVTLAVGVLGGGAFTSIILAVLGRRKTTAETQSIAVTTLDSVAERLTREIARLDERMAKALGEAVIANERADEHEARERSCRAELNMLTDRYARLASDLAMVKARMESVEGRVTSIEPPTAASDMLRQAGIAILEKVAEVHEVALAVKDEVSTINGRSLAQLADQAESARITDLPPAQRTDADVEHLDVVPLEDEPK